jgi:hypothetical protein
MYKKNLRDNNVRIAPRGYDADEDEKKMELKLLSYRFTPKIRQIILFIKHLSQL